LKFLDIAVAVLIGASAITGILVWSPLQGDAASAEFAARTRLRDSLLEIVQGRGIPWLIQTPTAEVCAALADMSNSSVSYSAILGSYSCPASPPADSVSETIILRLLPMAVTLEAWSDVQA